MKTFTSLFSKKESEDLEASEVSSEPMVPSRTKTTKKPWLSRFRPGAKRDAQIAHLQIGYYELIDLIRSVRSQLERQSEFDEKLTGTLDYVPQAVEGLNKISEHTALQRQVLTTLQEQIRAGAENDRNLIQGLHRFNKTLSTMDESNQRAHNTLVHLVENAKTSEQQICTLLKRSEKRFTVIVSCFSIAILLVIGCAVYFALSHPSSLPLSSRNSISVDMDKATHVSQHVEEDSAISDQIEKNLILEEEPSHEVLNDLSLE